MLDEPFERAWCSLLGLAVGDAFGETMAEGDAAKRIAKRLLLRRRPWRWTDDTAMALSIVELLGRHGTIDPDALAAAFVRRWHREPDRGYGLGAFQLLHRVHAGAAWRVEARGLFGGQGSFGNGAAMRAAPIGAYFAPDLERVRAEALRSAEPTHAHPDGEGRRRSRDSWSLPPIPHEVVCLLVELELMKIQQDLDGVGPWRALSMVLEQAHSSRHYVDRQDRCNLGPSGHERGIDP